jgi:hypothetical protein
MSKKKTSREAFLLPFILSNINSKTKDKLDLDEKEEKYIEEKKVSLILANNLNKFKINQTMN